MLGVQGEMRFNNAFYYFRYKRQVGDWAIIRTCYQLTNQQHQLHCASQYLHVSTAMEHNKAIGWELPDHNQARYTGKKANRWELPDHNQARPTGKKANRWELPDHNQARPTGEKADMWELLDHNQARPTGKKADRWELPEVLAVVDHVWHQWQQTTEQR